MEWQWIADNREYITDLAVDHLWLSVVPIALGFAIAVPIGWGAHRLPRLRGVIVNSGALLYTIPSLPLLVLLPNVLGTGYLDPVNLVVTLTIYAVAVMVRSAADGFDAVPAAVRDAATASGFSTWQRFRSVELPLAGPVLLAGVRVVAVSTVSLVSVGALVGVSNLGYLFTTNRDFDTEVFTGVGAIVLLALLIDAVLVLSGRLLMPWVRRTA